MKSKQVKELVEKWRKVAALQDDEWGVDGNDYRACADALEQAEREAAGQSEPTSTAGWKCTCEFRKDSSQCMVHGADPAGAYMSPPAAPRPEASTRKLRERIWVGLKAADKILREMTTEERNYMPCSEWDIIESQLIAALAAQPEQKEE